MPPRKSASPVKRSPKKRSPVRKSSGVTSEVLTPVRDTEYLINEVDAAPSREIFMVMNYVGYLFVLTALAAGIAWIYYTAKAKDEGKLGDNDDRRVDTASICFQAAVVSALLYFVARHHFHQHH